MGPGAIVGTAWSAETAVGGPNVTAHTTLPPAPASTGSTGPLSRPRPMTLVVPKRFFLTLGRSTPARSRILIQAAKLRHLKRRGWSAARPSTCPHSQPAFPPPPPRFGLERPNGPHLTSTTLWFVNLNLNTNPASTLDIPKADVYIRGHCLLLFHLFPYPLCPPPLLSSILLSRRRSLAYTPPPPPA
jgi:hypothetical protein